MVGWLNSVMSFAMVFAIIAVFAVKKCDAPWILRGPLSRILRWPLENDFSVIIETQRTLRPLWPSQRNTSKSHRNRGQATASGLKDDFTG